MEASAVTLWRLKTNRCQLYDIGLMRLALFQTRIRSYNPQFNMKAHSDHNEQAANSRRKKSTKIIPRNNVVMNLDECDKKLFSRPTKKEARSEIQRTNNFMDQNSDQRPNADLRSNRGRLSIKLIAKVFDMSVADIGRLIGRPDTATLHKTPDAKSLQEPLRPFADISLLRSAGYSDEDFYKWLRAPSELMRMHSPLDLIYAGHLRDVAGWVFGTFTGQPS